MRVSLARQILRRVRSAGARWWLGRRGVSVKGRVRLIGRPEIYAAPGSRIVLGDDVTLVGKSRANTLDARGPCVVRTVSDVATIEIGESTGITSGTLSAARSISIGARCLIGAGAVITDSDHHLVDANPWSQRRHAKPISEPGDEVVIGDDVFIGTRTIVLKGVTIGAGSVVAAGSVVVTDIPTGVIAGGNPARVLRSLGSD